ncbi:tandem-95 repeat protein, partial [Candidatus Woesearchaeota archaeon]|nr:tandem-95 repeat protein [Candidatus Woesearchaeota archaeon]
KTITTNEDNAGTVNVSTGASDPESDTLTYSVVANAASGTCAISNTTLTYTPNANYNGSDSCTFKANDSSLDSVAATVSITVNAVNDAPVAVPESYTVNEDAVLSVNIALGLLANDTDVEGSALIAAKVANPSSGSATVNADGSFTYTPNANFNGTDTFTYKANDGTADSNTATVTITVNAMNDAPVAVAQAVSTNEDTAKAITLSGTDTDGNPLTFSIAGCAAPANGTLSGIAGGVITYTPNNNFNGADSFGFKANDGTADSSCATVTVTVTAVNDAPIVTNKALTTNEDIAGTVNIAGTDPDGDALTYSVVVNAANGSCSISSATLTYTPNANWSGSNTCTFKANDGVLGGKSCKSFEWHGHSECRRIVYICSERKFQRCRYIHI